MNRPFSPLIFPDEKKTQISRLFNAILCTLALILCLTSAVNAAEMRGLIISADKAHYNLSPFVDILEDKEKKWTIDDVASPARSGSFLPHNKNTINIGLTSSAYWIRFTIGAAPEISDKTGWFLDIDVPSYIQLVKLFIPAEKSSGIKWQVREGGSRIALPPGKSAFDNVLFEIPRPIDRPVTFFLRVESESPIFLPLSICTGDHFDRKLITYNRWYGIFYGILAAMLLYNLFMFISLRDKSLFYYIFYLSFTILYFLGINGLLKEYFVPGSPGIAIRVTGFALGLLLLSSTIFARSFLMIKGYSRVLDYFFKGAVLLGLILAVVGILGYDHLLNKMATLIGLIVGILLFVAGMIRWYNGFRAARFFVVAFFFVICGGAVYALTVRGIISYTALSFYSFQLGSVLQAILLSLALVDRINELRKEKVKAQAELKSGEIRYRTLFDGVPISLYRAGRKQFFDVNAAMVQMLGYPDREALLAVKPTNIYLHSEDRKHWLELMEREGIVRNFEFQVRRYDGSIIWIGNNSHTLKDDQGQLLHYEGSMEDITEKKKAEEELEKHRNHLEELVLQRTTDLASANEKLLQEIADRRSAEEALKKAKDAADAANRSKSVFLANMSHEIRTPMNAILGFAQLMQRDHSLSTQSREHLDIINRSGEHLLATINDILEMSKIEAGRTVFAPTTFDLHALLHDLERMFRLRTDSKKLRFLMEKVGQVPRWVITDEGKLRQVLINLLGNAVKFTDEGGIVLRLGGKVENANTVNLQIEVEDTGPGVDEEELGRLFQAFEQTRSGVKSGGTGLGLALSQGFIQILGGTISVVSTVGKGSIFRFNIPVQEGSEEHAAKKEAKQHVQCLMPGQNEIRVLIADDRETNRLLLSQMLGAVGFATRDAVNGAEAVQIAQEWKPQVVLMDMAMPVMDGYEATRKIKESPDLRDTAIIALTASAFEEDKQLILAAGADGYMSKPFKDAELFETIGRVTGAKYLYEETCKGVKVSETMDDKALMRKTVASLPPDLVNRLRNAVESADLDLLNELAGQLATDHPTIAQRMREMAARYEYEALIELFSPGG